MLFSFLRDRDWKRKFSFLNRKCYVTGKSLKFTIAYRGRKYILNFVSGNRPIIDDVWLSKTEFLSRYSRNQL